MNNENHISPKKNKQQLHNIVKIAVLAAIAAILMLFEFPLPFAPGFYKLDLSETVILMGGFAMGPVASLAIELLKNALNLLMNGTDTAFIGEFANFLIGCSLVLPASWIYAKHKNFKGAVIGLTVGILSLALVGSLMNYFVLIPAFCRFYGLSTEAVIGAGSAVNPLIGDLKTLIFFAVAPFNLVKGFICAILNLILYKRLSKILHI